MKKTLIILALLVPSVSMASVDFNIKYGQSGNQVSELQDFLVDKGFLKTNPTGYFGLLTFKAVKEYQSSEGLPSTGYVGVLTRGKINSELESVVASSTEAENNEASTTPVKVGSTAPVIEQVIAPVIKVIEKSMQDNFTGIVSDLKEVNTISPRETKRYTLDVTRGNAATTLIEIPKAGVRMIGGDNTFSFSVPEDNGVYTYTVTGYSDTVKSINGQAVYPTQVIGVKTGTFEIK